MISQRELKFLDTDLIWNYSATIIKLTGGVLLMPLILGEFNVDEIGIWTIFVSISSLVGLFDLGFSPTFIRYINYVVNGGQMEEGRMLFSSNLKISMDSENYSIIVKLMREFYNKVSLLVTVALVLGGSIYLYLLTKNNLNLDKLELVASWVVFVLSCAIQIKNLNYESILVGNGKLTIVKKIITLNFMVFMFSSIILVNCGFSYFSIVFSQLLSNISNRVMMIKRLNTFRPPETLLYPNSIASSQLKKLIYKDSVSVGITSIGGFLVNRSSLFISSFYLSLKTIGDIGIVLQLISVMNAMSFVYFSSKQFQITQLILSQQKNVVLRHYLNNFLILLGVYCVGYVFLILVNGSDSILSYRNSIIQNKLLLVCFLGISLLERNHNIAANYLLYLNKNLFLVPSLVSGLATVILLLCFLEFTNLGTLSVILAPGIVQLLYQNWRWPLLLLRLLKINEG